MTSDSGCEIAVFNRNESNVRSYCRTFNAIFDTARGSLIRSTRGVEYIDFLAGCGSLNYGHNDPDMAQALIEYVERGGISHGLDFHTECKADFLESFQTFILKPRGLDYRVQFTGPTGANAVEAALKLARKVTGRTNVIAFTNGFHGVTQGALAATGNRKHRIGPAIPLNGVARLPYDGYLGPDIDTADLLEKMLADASSGLDAPAAILLEAVQGEGGLNVARPEWLRRIADLARTHGALLIVDEIQTGCGRTGGYFSFENAGIVPDLVPMAKSLSGYGLPMAALLIRPEFDVWKPGEHNGTFRGNQHAFVTAQVSIKKFWSDKVFEREIARKSAILHGRLMRIARHVPGARLKGRGMMQGIDFGSGKIAGAICAQAFRDGLIIETSGPEDEVIKVLAPLTTPDDLMHLGLDILTQAVLAVAGVAATAAE
jgi:diaminobutyrate-2-oxoglutarate transaminase